MALQTAIMTSQSVELPIFRKIAPMMLSETTTRTILIKFIVVLIIKAIIIMPKILAVPLATLHMFIIGSREFKMNFLSKYALTLFEEFVGMEISAIICINNVCCCELLV
jgi:hypothetical protein